MHTPSSPVKSFVSAVFISMLACAANPTAASPFSDQPLTGNTVQVSEHVWAITGWPNVGIVVGTEATLVVDTGLGKRNGATVAAAARKLAPNNRLYVTTTHFHPEHVTGVLAFPPGTILLRNRAQQDEMDRHGEEMIRLFSVMNEQWKTWLAGGELLRAPDVTFEREARVNLGGGVTARLLHFGAAHTRGDELVFVDPDRTLLSGDVVQNKTGPFIYGEGGTAAGWIAVVDEAARLEPRCVLPDHSPVGDGSLVAHERAFLVELRERALQLKRQETDVLEAGKLLTAEFKQKYPDWSIDDLTGFVKGAYTE